MPKREKFPFVNTLLKLTNGEYKYYVRRRRYDDVPKIGRLTEFDDEFVNTIATITLNKTETGDIVVDYKSDYSFYPSFEMARESVRKEFEQYIEEGKYIDRALKYGFAVPLDKQLLSLERRQELYSDTKETIIRLEQQIAKLKQRIKKEKENG